MCNSYLEQYLDDIQYDDIRTTVQDITNEIFNHHLKSYDYKSNINGLLLGEVQSGKTGQMFGVIAAAADRDFQIFLVLTTDNNRLQKQTVDRAKDSFDKNFCVCGETDTDILKFKINKMRKPLIIVLKKNSSILKKWRNELINSNYLDGRPLFIIDDEADAASLNTKINQNNFSTINRHIQNIKDAASAYVYLQVTATPQAILLQTQDSNFKPSFVSYFRPGRAYLGGDFFFSKPGSYCIRFIEDDESKTIKIDNNEITEGLSCAILHFFIVCAHIRLSNYRTIEVSNFLIHPSVKIKDHQIIAEKIGEFLNDILSHYEDEDIKENIKKEWENLYESQPEIQELDKISECMYNILFNSEFSIVTLNSESDVSFDFCKGFNIVIGGNTLGRGVTFPHLQTIYYSRFSKKPQADTFWQHCRMFGYDRERGLIRLFMPGFIYKLFQELNASQKALIDQITQYGIDNVHLLYNDKIIPTRKNVIKSSRLSLITGGVNYFAAFPENRDITKLNNILLDKATPSFTDVNTELILEILSEIYSNEEGDWDSKSFINAIQMLLNSNNKKTAKLLVRTQRKLTKGTGTMLSANDRDLINQYNEDISLIMYQIIGGKESNWDKSNFWMPNIKLPSGFIFYKMT